MAEALANAALGRGASLLRRADPRRPFVDWLRERLNPVSRRRAAAPRQWVEARLRRLFPGLAEPLLAMAREMCLDRRREEIARTLGASLGTVNRRVTLLLRHPKVVRRGIRDRHDLIRVFLERAGRDLASGTRHRAADWSAEIVRSLFPKLPSSLVAVAGPVCRGRRRREISAEEGVAGGAVTCRLAALFRNPAVVEGGIRDCRELRQAALAELARRLAAGT